MRPEFKIFLDHESKIINLVNDVADTLEQAAVGQMHTPTLYSVFLRALVSAKTEPPSNHDGQQLQVPNGIHTAPHEVQLSQTNPNNPNLGMLPVDPLSEFQFDSEMGPVADMSTFPPTMATNVVEDHFGMLTMDSILSASFWDSVLVPGTFTPSLCFHFDRTAADRRCQTGYSNTMEGISGGFVYGAGGSGLITPRLGISPLHSGFNTPASHKLPTDLTQHKIDTAFDVGA